MARNKTKTPTPAIDETLDATPTPEAETTPTPEAETTPTPEPEADPAEEAAIAEIDAQIALPRSVVGRAYKIRYKERAIAEGRRGKAHKRCNGDWLALELMAQTLDDKEKLIVSELEAILTANGIKHEGWNRTTNGWQGRLRMTGRMALQRKVAETGVLVLADGETLEAPADWVAKHTH